MTMQCRDVRQQADAYLAQELLVESRLDVARHLEGCPECRADLAGRQALRSTLRRAFLTAGDLAMSPGFAETIARDLRASVPAATPALARRWWAAAAATAALAAAAALVFVAGWDSSRLLALARDAWGDHRNCAVAFHLREKPITLEEASWTFDPMFANLQTVPGATVSTPDGDAVITERHSCVFDGRRYAHIVMRFRGQLVSLLVAQDREGGFESAVRAVSLSPGRVRVVHVDGADAAMFRTASHMVVLVGDLPADDLRRLAQALVGSVSKALA